MVEPGNESPVAWQHSTARRWSLPVVSGIAIVGLSLAIGAVYVDDTASYPELLRELGGAVVSGAIVALAILLFEEAMEEHRAKRDELLERQRDAHDSHVASVQMRHSLFTSLAMRDDLEGIVLAGHDLQSFVGAGRGLQGANLRQTNLAASDLSESDLSGADLWNADLSEADLSRTDLSGGSLLFANLSGANLLETKFSGASLHMANLRDAQILGGDFSGADLSDADLSGVVVGKAAAGFGFDLDLREGVYEMDFSDDGLRPGKEATGLLVTDFSQASLVGANLCGADLSRSDLSGADLEGAMFSDDTIWPSGFVPPEMTSSTEVSGSNRPGAGPSATF